MVQAVWLQRSKSVQFQRCIKCHVHSDTPLFGSLVVDVNVYRNRGLTCLGTNEFICINIQTDNQSQHIAQLYGMYRPHKLSARERRRTQVTWKSVGDWLTECFIRYTLIKKWFKLSQSTEANIKKVSTYIWYSEMNTVTMNGHRK